MLALALAARTVYADVGDEEDRALTTLVAEQVRALNARDAKAFAATFYQDGFAILPGAGDEARGTAAIAALAKRWLTSVGNTSFKLDKPHYGSRWYAGELVLTDGARLRITGILRANPTEGGPLVYNIGAIHISEPADDRAVLAAAAAGKIPALPKLAGAGAESGAREDAPDKIATFADRITDDPAAVVVGAAATEHAIGKAAISKLLVGWRSLKLASGERIRYDDGNRMLLGWYVGHTEATVKSGGKTVKVPYRVLCLVMQPWAVARDQSATATLLAAHLSVALH